MYVLGYLYIQLVAVLSFNFAVSSRNRCGKDIVENLVKLMENSCVGVSFLIKLHASGLQLYQKRDSDNGDFLLNLRDF